MESNLLLKKSLLLPVALFFVITSAFAQTKTVTGTVVDATDNSPLPGVSIQVEGTSRGTVTGINGNYSIEASDSDVLVFSFIGYNTTEITVGMRSTIDVALEVNVTELEEIVVIGYGTVQKDDATGAVAAVSEEEFNRGIVNSPQDLLKGRTAGVQITTSGGAPGAGAAIRIRGGSSLLASNSPLIILDGVPLDNDGIAGMSNPLSSINPNDIATFTVLKDASATAIYGSRASNGVIIITTKRGQLGKPTLSYSGNLSFSVPGDMIENLSADEFREIVTERSQSAGNNTPAEAADLLGSASTDWQSLILSPSVSTDHSLSLSGSTAGVPYRTSVGYTNQNGILLGSQMERITAAVGLDPSFLDDQLSAKLNFKYALSEHDFANQGAIGSAITFDPTQSPYTDSNDFGGYFFWDQSNNPGVPVGLAPANPLALLEQNENIGTVNRFIANAEVEYKLPFLEGLSAKLNIGTDRSFTNGINETSTEAAYSYDAQHGTGRQIDYYQEKLNDILETYLSYQTELPSISSDLNVTGGYSWQHFKRSGNSSEINLTDEFVYNDLEYAGENYLVSFFGRANLNMNDKYILTLTLRRDGSSRFAEENRWGLFPAMALAWKLENESFMENQDLFSQLKLRLGYGVTGQQDVGADYPALATVNLSEPTARYQFGGDFYRTIRYQAYDSQLKWEETTTYNAGLDFGILADRVTGSVDYYYRATDDLLNSVPIPIGTNFSNFLLTNVGSLTNQGVEINLNGFVIDNEQFQWELGYNVTFNRNKITKLTLVDDPEYLGVLTGGISGGVGNTVQIHSVGNSAFDFFMYEQVYDESGTPIEGLYVDQNGDGIINDFDRVAHENPAPNAFMGFSSFMNYQDFSLTINARANIGNYVYNNVESGLGNYGNIYPLADYLGNMTRSVFDTQFENPQYLSQYYLSNASFFRLDNITLSYDAADLTDVADFTFSLTAQNALVLTRYGGIDPEIFGGIDNNIYPRPTNFILSVRANF